MATYPVGAVREQNVSRAIREHNVPPRANEMRRHRWPSTPVEAGTDEPPDMKIPLELRLRQDRQAQRPQRPGQVPRRARLISACAHRVANTGSGAAPFRGAGSSAASARSPTSRLPRRARRLSTTAGSPRQAGSQPRCRSQNSRDHPDITQPPRVPRTGIPQAGIRGHRLPQANLAKSALRGAMGVVATRLRLSRVRQQAGRRVTTADVLRALHPIWNTKRETARRTRQRISAVMKAAIAAGHRADNPAADALTSALPKGGQVQKHQRALPHDQVAGRSRHRARLERLGLHEARFRVPGPHRRALRRDPPHGRDEVDLDARLWTVPAERMKARREHRVPLSPRATDLLAEAAGFQENELVFPSATGRPMSDATLSKLVRELGINAVPHGFRSSFRDWCGDTGATPRTRRGGPSAYNPQQGGSGLRQVRPARTTPRAHGRLEHLPESRQKPISPLRPNGTTPPQWI